MRQAIQLSFGRGFAFDRAFFVLLFVVMCDRLTENPLHEVLGVLAGAFALLHLLLNRRWYARRFERMAGRMVSVRAVRANNQASLSPSSGSRRTRPTSLQDRFLLPVNGLLTIGFAASFLSGLMCSQTLLAGLTPEAWRMDLVYRMIHVTLSMWFFAAAALHAGLHLVPLLGSALMSVFSVAANHLVKRVGLWVLFLLAVARIWIASETRTFDLLFTFESAYIPVERGELPFLMPLDLLLLFLLLAFVGYGVSWIAAKRSASR